MKWLRRTWLRMHNVKIDGVLPDWLERTNNLEIFKQELPMLRSDWGRTYSSCHSHRVSRSHNPSHPVAPYHTM